MRHRRLALLGAICACAAVLVGRYASAAPDEPDRLTTALKGGISVEQEPLLAPDVCLPDTTPASLDTLFYGYPAGIIGADYPRTVEIPTSAILWTFQDAKMLMPGGELRILHNIGMVQRGNCFTLLRSGTTSNPRPWLFPDQTIDRKRWFWPLDAEVGSDGRVYVYLAGMREHPPSVIDPDVEPQRDYLVHTVPEGTLVAGIDPETWTVEYYGVPTNPSSDLYGWSIETDDHWTYFYAQCHRQFGFDPYVFGTLAHDRSCTDRVTVGRVPKGQLFDPMTYWTGSSWSTEPSLAAPIIEQTNRFANPTQFLFHNNHWTAVTKIDDWWGQTIVVEQARRPTGPFEEIARFTPRTKCALECNTYFASWAVGQSGSSDTAPLTVSISHNRWDGTATDVYRPSFFTIAPPPNIAFPADRCALGHCD